jgi:UTP--glucose-1-phosphate uridylyltransferase
MMEVADRTEMDKKGGHLAKRKRDGQLVLRELAQCPEDDLDSFQDIERYRYFNTNNLWINLEAFQKVMEEQDYQMGLPMIRNRKTVDPRDSCSTPVYQLETAMGSAIAVFKGSQAVRVPRTRFAPVKKTDDLLVVRSDVYLLSDDFEVIQNPERSTKAPVVELDGRFYKFVSDLDARFPQGAPSLLECERLRVEGDFLFEENVICRGEVELRNDSEDQVSIGAGTILCA